MFYQKIFCVSDKNRKTWCGSIKECNAISPPAFLSQLYSVMVMRRVTKSLVYCTLVEPFRKQLVKQQLSPQFKSDQFREYKH